MFTALIATMIVKNPFKKGPKSVEMTLALVEVKKSSKSVVELRLKTPFFVCLLGTFLLFSCTQPQNQPAKLPVNTASTNAYKIVILGDSLTQGYGVHEDDAYPAVLQQMLQDKGKNIEVVNAGSSGATTASGLSRLEWHLQSKPNMLIIALGANDGLRGIDLATSRENLSQMIDLALQNQLQVFLAGMKLPYNYGEEYRDKFETMFQDLVQEKKIFTIDFILEGVGGEAELNLPDGIHPNEKGHKIMAQNVFNSIEKVLP